MSSPRRRPRGIKIEYRHGKSCPRFWCDGCGCPISKADLAGLVYAPATSNKIQQKSVRFLCKDRGTGTAGFHGCLSDPCNRHLPWMELATFLMHLCQNVGMKSLADFQHELEIAKLTNQV